MSYLFMRWQWSIICLIAYNSGRSYRKSTIIGLTSSENEGLLLGVTPDPLSYVDIVSASDR
jgi:hypothetical protein